MEIPQEGTYSFGLTLFGWWTTVLLFWYVLIFPSLEIKLQKRYGSRKNMEKQ